MFFSSFFIFFFLLLFLNLYSWLLYWLCLYIQYKKKGKKRMSKYCIVLADYSGLMTSWYVVTFASQTSQKFPLQFMSIYSNEDIRKITKLSPRKFPHLVQNAKISVRENYCVYSNVQCTVQTCVQTCDGEPFKLTSVLLLPTSLLHNNMQQKSTFLILKLVVLIYSQKHTWCCEFACVHMYKCVCQCVCVCWG